MRAGLVFNRKLFSSFIIAMSCSLVCMSVYAQLDDPTRPPGYRLALPGGEKRTKGTTGTTFSLSSIRISSARRTAVINDRTLEVGDKINAAKVVAIYPSSVKLKKQGKFFTVRLLSRITKKARTN